MVNIRLQNYKKNRIAGMNCFNAARAAGYSEATARSHTKDLEEQVKMPDVLERKGLTDSYLADKVKELVEAVDVITIENENTGVELRGSKPNWSTRTKGLELALKLKDLLKDKPIVDISTHYHFTTIKEAVEYASIGDTKARDRALENIEGSRELAK